MNIGIIVSGGGHLDEALAVLEAFEGHEIFLVSYRLSSLEGFSHPKIKKVYFVSLRGSSGLGLYYSLFLNIFEFLGILLRERPQVLFSTGSEVAVAPFFMAKFILGSRLIFLETFTRVSKSSFTARILYPICDVFLLQWETLRSKFGRKARYQGRVI
jgi:beta-1,4-N-acetylglucosaminyltransferase